jgi:hypothetical protein
MPAALRSVLAVLALVFLIGCAVADPPINDRPNVVATPQKGEMTVTSEASDTVGNVTPVYVSIANGTNTPRTLVPGQIFALNGNGDRIAPLPAGEAARQAGGAGALKACLKSAAVSGAGGAAVGSAVGAIGGAILGHTVSGAAIGGASGLGSGIIRGVGEGQHAAQQQANEQIHALALKPGEIRRDFTVSGYVFFPKGNYSDIEMLLVDGETGNTETVRQPWH